MGIPTGLVFLVGMHLSNTKIETINIDLNDLESKPECPPLSQNYGRCGSSWGGRCNKNLADYAVYCNEDNGWCGVTSDHEHAQSSDIYDWEPESCKLCVENTSWKTTSGYRWIVTDDYKLDTKLQIQVGYRCADYAINKWCENGGIGSAWKESWKWLTDTNGFNARSVCCICGGNGKSGDVPYLPDGMPDHSITGRWNKYAISGSILTQIILTDSGTDKNLSLGHYHSTKGHTTFYDGGTYCDRIWFNRFAQIQWRCGTRDYEIISVTEPSFCMYHLIGELRCNNLTNSGVLDSEDDDDDNDISPDTLDNDDDVTSDRDLDGDGIPDEEDYDDDEEDNRVPNALDPDDDNDGISDNLDDNENGELEYDEYAIYRADEDTNGDGIPDKDDPDFDDNGISNVYDEDYDEDVIPANADWGFSSTSPTVTPKATATISNIQDLEDDYDDLPKNAVDEKGNYEEYSEKREYTIPFQLRTSTEAYEEMSQELNFVPSEMRKHATCVDQKVWCKFADCSLENVKRNCQKTCNNCP